MQYSDREYVVNKLISGCILCKFNNEPVCVFEPSPLDRMKAHFIYNKELQNAQYNGLLTEEDSINQMIKINMWNFILDKELKDLPKKIEDLKVELYEAYFQFRRRDSIKKSIENLKIREVELLQIKDKFKYTTCEGFALACKNKHLICSGTNRLDGSKFFINDNYESFSQIHLDLFMNEYFSQKVTEDEIRESSKTEPWKSIWNAGKHEGAIFGRPSSLLSQEQRMLIVWSRIYDSVYESPDCPPEEVVNDDDCLDGWLIVQARKRESDKKAEHGYKPGDKFNKADEVFILVDNPDDIGRVNSMNNTVGIIRKQQRMSALTKAGGKLADEYMPDSQQKMKEQLLQMQRDHFKRGK